MTLEEFNKATEEISRLEKEIENLRALKKEMKEIDSINICLKTVSKKYDFPKIDFLKLIDIRIKTLKEEYYKNLSDLNMNGLVIDSNLSEDIELREKLREKEFKEKVKCMGLFKDDSTEN